MGTGGPREGGAAEHGLDERLVDAAERLIDERGYEGLSAAEAAAGVELAGGPPSEWDLFVAVIRRDEDRFTAMTADAVARAETAGERLVALIERCVIEHDWTYWIELWSLARRDGRARDLRETLDTAFRGEIKKLVEAGRDSGEFLVADTDGAATAIATLIDALAVEATLGDTTVSPNFMLGACTSAAGRLVGAELQLRRRRGDG